ncbi:MAG: ATP-dependent RecD-like DNA helicase [Bacteroidales bacterium]|nr:ATP-dependent RecD-like DNA helicase [Clostridium sp.]MCM1203820.1 ATP-dependent RecD-like DNA helicase [Bacteroidales bacterium]
MEQEGIVSKIIYRNPDNQYIVFAVETKDGEDETFVGYLSGIEEGMYISAEGEYIHHPSYDLQFKVKSYQVKMPDNLVSMERYLSSGAIKGVGEIMAKRIIKEFGLDTFRIMEEEPERLAEIKGISERKANEIGVQFIEKQAMREALMFLSDFGVSPNLAVKIFNEYGQKMYTIVRNNPYKIAEDISGVGFKMADAIAVKAGIGMQSDFRVRAGILYTLNQATGLGHIYLPKRLLLSWTRQLLAKSRGGEEDGEDFYGGNPFAVPESGIEIQLMNLQVEGKVVMRAQEDGDIVYSARYYQKELDTARMLLETKSTAGLPDTFLDKTIAEIEDAEKITLDELQREAVRQAARQGVLVITGGPGTGKTTTINAIIKYFELEEMDMLLAAPTGRAAKRMTEATGYKAQTIHRLLELSGGVSEEENSAVRFERNASNPLEADVVIIDEMSMVDLSLMHALMLAVMPGTHLVLVGDENQLPSVGAGNVLKDIIRSGCIPVVALNKIFRQEEGSAIVENAHKINHGESIMLDNKSRDFFYLPRSSTKDIAQEVGQLLAKKLPPYVGCTSRDIQVLTPMRNGELGVGRLNAELQRVLNAPDFRKKEKELSSGTVFREGDKVMQIRNNYKLEWIVYSEKGRFKVEEGVGVFNGDMGVIKEIDDYNEELVVLFDDDKEVRYPYNLLDELELSYAITIHKSQGSEYPAVVLPLLSGPRVLMNRNLLYTAVTRARTCVTIVGNGRLVENMIQNNDEQKRYSSLDVRIAELAAEGF